MIRQRQRLSPMRKISVYIAALAVMGALGAERLLFRPSGEFAHAYHERVRHAAQQIPVSFDGWVGIDVPIPAAAIEILHPNVILSRMYQNLDTGERVALLLVQVTDARDILGHYPPVCYPAQGWSQMQSTPREWHCDQLPIAGTAYEFARERFDSVSTLSVLNVLFLPGGKSCRSMNEIESQAQSRREKFFGAGQVQLVTEKPLTPGREAEIFEKFCAWFSLW